jgi:alpha-amylase
MVSVCFYFQVHQPFRLNKFKIFDIGNNISYFDENKNKEYLKKIAENCYLPMNKVLMDLINVYGDKIKFSFSISGMAIEQFEKYAPKVLSSFKELAKTGCVEFLSETYYHSLSYLYSRKEFLEQVKKHREIIKKHFDQIPKVFRNTELVYNNDLAEEIENMGYDGIIAEGADNVLGWRSPNHVYEPSHKDSKIALLLKNYKLSDDIAFRFSDPKWESYPLTTEKYVEWLNQQGEESDIINLFMDYETFGEHQKKESGIFDFIYDFPEEFFKNKNNNFITPSEAIEKYNKKDKVDVPFYISWADKERDLSAWLLNKMQQEAMKDIYELEPVIKSLKDENLLEDWRKLTCSDHFYYMSTKGSNDGAVHGYFSPFDTPYDAYMYFMNILNDLIFKIKSDGSVSHDLFDRSGGNSPDSKRDISKGSILSEIKTMIKGST